VVDLATVPKGDDQDDKPIVIDRVDDAVVADTDPKVAASALQGGRSGWSWLIAELFGGAADSTGVCAVEFAELAGCGG